MIYIMVLETNFKTENSIKAFFKKKTINQIRIVFISKRTCAHLDLKGNKQYHTIFTVKDTSPLAL